VEKFLQAVDGMEARRRRVTRAALIAALCAVGYAWYHFVYCLPKIEYNRVHPYTSWIPITGATRQPRLRRRSSPPPSAAGRSQ
jgi:hypothetical protein